MACDSYIFNSLYKKGDVYSNCCESAAILSRYDGHIWACTPNFKLQSYYANVNEQFVLVHEGIELAKAAQLKAAPHGLRINKKKYLLLRYNDIPKSMYLRKKKGGACIAFSELTIVIATYSETLEVLSETGESFFQHPGLVNEQVEKLADFFRKVCY